jgi:putative nucleotide binding protein
MKMEEKEETAIVLDFLPNGYPLEGKMIPVAQAIGSQYFTLLHLVPRRGITLQLKEEVYIGSGKRDKISYILGRLPREKLTETAKMELSDFIGKIVNEREKQFVDFFNKAEPINTRLHQLELLPGFGKKHMNAIVEEREKKPFSSFEDIKKRIKSIPDPKKVIEKRLLEELTEEVKYKLFAA